MHEHPSDDQPDPHAAHGQHRHSAGETQPPDHTHDHAHAQPSAESLEHEAMDHAVHGRDVDHVSESGEHAAHIDHAAGSAEHAAHVDHTGHEQMFRRRFWVCLVLSIPVILYSESIQHLLGFQAPTFPGSGWVAPLFAVVVFAYGGLPFLSMARPELATRQPGMMTLISLAISVAFAYSVAALFLSGQESFFWELVTLIDIMLLGHWLEMRSVRRASGALEELARLMPDTAERVDPAGRIETVPASQLAVGDLLLVRPGASIPADGVVVEGESELNEAMVTGESRPVAKAPGDRVIAGTINGDGSLRVRVAAVGEQTALAGIMRLVREAQQSKSRTQILADRAAAWLFYIALAVAAVTAVAWTLATGFGVDVVARVATVLVIACPHALGLAVPLVVAITTTIGAANGILVRDRIALEEARLIDTMIFDKTGTLTRGEFGVVGVAVAAGWQENDAVALAAAVEADSEHTIARALRRGAEERALPLPNVEAFEAIKGRGVRAQSDGRELHLGGPRLLELLAVQLPPSLASFGDSASARGETVVYLIVSGEPAAAFALADVVRPESARAIRRLHEMGIEVAMLTGDSEQVAAAVAKQLGIDQYFAQVLPEHKDQKVAQLQAQGKRVAMVGDGVNDAPALTRADVGIAIGGGTDVAIESAGIILVRSDPLDAVSVIELSRATYRKMVQNLLWATGYNVVALPLAAGVLAPIGIVLTPAVGAVFMSVSTIIVALNAQTLRRWRPSDA
ncbi:MAG: copper-translocating P-type ATPase [Anaerolineae bacterium]